MTRYETALTEKASLEQKLHSLRSEFDNERKTRVELDSKNSELTSELN